jgi:hypothetical protein
MKWNEDTDELVTEYGTYQVEYYYGVRGYRAVLYDENYELIWHSESMPSGLNNYVDNPDLIKKCREYAIKHYTMMKCL